MTTQRDHGDSHVDMLTCELTRSNLYPTIVLALRDMRKANGRDDVTGRGPGNESWIGLTLAMVVLDTLSGEGRTDVGGRWRRFLQQHDVSATDAEIIYRLRCSLLHGYGLPKPENVFGRTVLLTPYSDAYAIDTTKDGYALVSVPVFCGRLTERIAAEGYQEWDYSLINTDYQYW